MEETVEVGVEGEDERWARWHRELMSLRIGLFIIEREF